MEAQGHGRNNFDFLVGSWKGSNRRLRERLADCTDWDTFDGRLVARNVLGGSGSFDEATLYLESGKAEGVNLRLYNPDTDEWSIFWASPGSDNLFPPMVGKFDNGRGVFYCYDLVAGQHIYARAIYEILNKDSFRWEQAFSADGGQNWETNWTCDFVRDE
jgi:hypothetical protein